ncbi:MAG: hypothetical protein B6244_14080 [Candidatus Cloacimonetes bacterium 4572_55]|nr:MAG: hypothetical protein B6244_14080 [Candidatus Cloacimonetes bacterium 4572_55]
MNDIVESYIKLALRTGQYDPDYIDSYHGPEEFRPAALSSVEEKTFPFEELVGQVQDLARRLSEITSRDWDRVEKLRHVSMTKQLESLMTEIKLIFGAQMSFDEESQALYDVVAPAYDVEQFGEMINNLDKILPGSGDILTRFNKLKEHVSIPTNRLEKVFDRVFDECRRRTQRYISLPEGENFTIEYVKDAPWAAYNWYKGNGFSLIQINTDFPTRIHEPLHLAAHEGYPGHHLFHSLLEKNLGRERGWMEFCIAPLFCPAAIIAEGTAEYGVDLVFPKDERIEFELSQLFPIAGLDARLAEVFYQALECLKGIRGLGIEVSRGYLDEKIDREQAIEMLVRYGLRTRERAEQNLKFADRYGSYVVTYSLGKDLIREYIETRSGREESPGRKWELFYELISTPQVPSGLRP